MIGSYRERENRHLEKEPLSTKSTYISRFRFIEWHSMDDSSKTFCDPCKLVEIMKPYNSVQMSIWSICMTFLSNFSNNLPRWMWNTPFYVSEFQKISLLPLFTQAMLTTILKEEGSLTDLTFCHYSNYLIGISCIFSSSKSFHFQTTKSKPVRTGGQPYVIFLPSELRRAFPRGGMAQR